MSSWRADTLLLYQLKEGRLPWDVYREFVEKLFDDDPYSLKDREVARRLKETELFNATIIRINRSGKIYNGKGDLKQFGYIPIDPVSEFDDNL